jgi:hypothetical protein
MSTAEKSAADFHAMADHTALAMLADRRDGLNGALKAVESMPSASRNQLESLVIFITANFAFRHMAPHFSAALV